MQSGHECTTPTSLARQASLPQTQSYVYKGAGLSVSVETCPQYLLAAAWQDKSSCSLAATSAGTQAHMHLSDSCNHAARAYCHPQRRFSSRCLSLYQCAASRSVL